MSRRRRALASFNSRVRAATFWARVSFSSRSRLSVSHLKHSDAASWRISRGRKGFSMYNSFWGGWMRRFSSRRETSCALESMTSSMLGSMARMRSAAQTPSNRSPMRTSMNAAA